ncbi:MAG: peroxidase-related enzyme [Rhodothermaceae bacterium]|nr:peroxidase-related enzyme [Rhodothermaceae bacterium]
MAWIDVTPETDATGELRAVYDHIEQARGKLSNIMRVHSLHPEAMRTHMDLYLALLFSRSGLKRAERELLATVVSAANGCAYCTRHHSEALNAYWKDETRVAQVVEEYTAADLSARERAMLDYGVALTRAPAAVSETDVDALRAVGFSDSDVLDIALITAYFNFVNRIAEGLGVELSEEEAAGYKY